MQVPIFNFARVALRSGYLPDKNHLKCSILAEISFIAVRL